ncbi:MAG: hypothetical protein JSR37_04795 [Verrucomicrobia bacterium]|nr:hypothetical protein [Verrucomicrobiota bacterium]MBS0636250.1 hypothetical protein [Verrucomicrobiota bacterium]
MSLCSIHESTFDAAWRVKSQRLSPEEHDACHGFVKNIPQKSEYLEALSAIFHRQLAEKIGSAIQDAPAGFIERRVVALMKSFLKEKLGVQKPIEPNYQLADRALWDPHSHSPSLFAPLFPEVCHHMPNFEAAYAALKPKAQDLLDRRISHLQTIMQARECPQFTELGSGYDKWHLEHAGKKFLPLFAYKRSSESQLRDDVRGYDFCGPENERDYESVQHLFQNSLPDQIVRVHMGETTLPESGRKNVSRMLQEAKDFYRSKKPLRIGHATHISLDDMLTVSKMGAYIEACLSSNKKTAIIAKRSEYPLAIMLLLDVKVVIGTDGGHLYNTTLAKEYGYAARCLQKFHSRLGKLDEPVELLNGDQLKLRHINTLIKPDAPSEDPETVLSYRSLARFIDQAHFVRISCDRLVQNARDLLQACYDL